MSSRRYRMRVKYVIQFEIIEISYDIAREYIARVFASDDTHAGIVSRGNYRVRSVIKLHVRATVIPRSCRGEHIVQLA